MPNTTTPDNTSSSTSPTIQAELDSFTSQITSLMNQKAIIDTQAQQLLYMPSNQRTLEDNITLSNLQTQSAAISANITELKQKESIASAAFPVSGIVNKTVQETIQPATIANVPTPKSGTVAVTHQVVQDDDLISYMALTQHLNPYGRKRQCDSDLEDLMVVINKYINIDRGKVKQQLSNIKSLQQ